MTNKENMETITLTKDTLVKINIGSGNLGCLLVAEQGLATAMIELKINFPKQSEKIEQALNIIQQVGDELANELDLLIKDVE